MVDARAGAGAQVLARLDMAVMMSSDFFLYGAVYGLGISLLCAIRPMRMGLSGTPRLSTRPVPAPRPPPPALSLARGPTPLLPRVGR